MRKHRRILIIVVLIGLLLSLSGITYAYLRVSKIQEEDNELTVLKCLNITIEEENDIKLDNAYAITDEEGKSLTPYKFIVKNNCDMIVKISVNLEDLTVEKKLDDQYIKLLLESELTSTTNLLSNYEEASLTQENGVQSHKLLSNYLAANAQMEYKLRLWIDENTTWEEGKDKSYKGKVVVNAEPALRREYKFEYTGTYQEFIAPEKDYYVIELWGAGVGATNHFGGYGGEYKGGYGAYTKGTILLEEGEKLYIYVGEQGKNGLIGNDNTSTLGLEAIATFNGGGAGGLAGGGEYPYSKYTGGFSGSGATDIRYFENNSLTNDDLLWNSDIGLKSRIMVAGGGGGAGSHTSNNGYTYSTYCGSAGGLSGENGQTITVYETYNYTSKAGVAGTQTSGYSFGIGGTGDKAGRTGLCNGHSGGGGGYYGGKGALNSGGACHIIGGGGGSSYISGHTGCVAITSSADLSPRVGTNQNSCTEGTTDNLCSLHYSNKYFTSTVMIDGSGYTWTNVKTNADNLMPNPDGGYYESGVGHTGNGYAKITALRAF